MPSRPSPRPGPRTSTPGPHEAIVRPAYRWECHCRQPPVLLGTYDLDGSVNIKIRDRYWHIEGRVATTCPKCGRQHVLDLALDPDFVKTLPGPWQPGQ